MQASYREFVVGNFETLMCRVGGRRAGAHRVIFFGAAPRVPCSQTAFRTNGFGFSCIQGINPKADLVVA